MAFCNPCVRPANSSIVTYNQRPTNSIKALLRRRLFKKPSALTPSRPPIHRPIRNHSQTTVRFQRIKGTNIVREVNPISECNSKTDSINNYDMTIFHDDQLDDTGITLSHRQSKQIPRWARKSQLQLALINQIYFNDKNPDDIFGPIHIDLAHQMIELQTTELPLLSSSSMIPLLDLYSMFPPNFV